MGCTLCRARSDRFFVGAVNGHLILADQAPICPGHLLVISSSHAPSSDDLARLQREAMSDTVTVAAEISRALTGREPLILEHGRSPTCGDASCSCHAHVHVAPVGEADLDPLESLTALEQAEGPGSGEYLRVRSGSADHHYRPRWVVPHLARTVAAVVAQENGVPWQPIALGPETRTADATANSARSHLAKRQPTNVRPLKKPVPSEAPPLIHSETQRRARKRPTFVVIGPTGAGKTSLGVALADLHRVPAVELGVLLRLACLRQPSNDPRKVSALLWRWYRRGRMDFDGASRNFLTAAVPRLDGDASEREMWTDIDTQRMSSLARSPVAQETLSAIAAEVSRTTGGVIVARVAPEFDRSAITDIPLTATAQERARRKNLQLNGIGLSGTSHDWFTPHSVGGDHSGTSRLLDTTNLPRVAVVRAALAWGRQQDDFLIAR